MEKKEEENTHSQCVSVPLFSTACSFCLPPCVSSGANTQTMLYVDCYCASWGDRLSASRVRVHANRSSINGLLTYIRFTTETLCTFNQSSSPAHTLYKLFYNHLFHRFAQSARV